MMKLSDFDGRLFDVVRDGSFATLGNVTSAPDAPCLTFVTNGQYLVRACKMPVFTCIICPRELVAQLPADAGGRGIATADDPKSAFQMFHNWLAKQNTGYAPTPDSMGKTQIGTDCSIDASAHISPVGVKIGDRVTIEENVIIRPGTCIEDDVFISAGAVIGTYGLLRGQKPGGDPFLITETGSLRIKKGVYVGNYSYIERGLFPYESTVVGQNTYISVEVVISHNCQIGKNCCILPLTQICGNTVLEDGVHVAPHAVISNRMRIGANARVDLGAVVVNNVRSGLRVAGNFAIEHGKFLLWHKNKLKVKKENPTNKG